MASKEPTGLVQNQSRAWRARYDACPPAISRSETSSGSAVENGARSVVAPATQHQGGVVHEGQDGAKQCHPVGECGGPEHPARTLLLLGKDDAVLGEQARARWLAFISTGVVS